jgi:hypothetical protein
VTWLGLLLGCSVPREDFPAAKADALCDVQKRCARGTFHAEWADMDACRQWTEDDVEVEVEEFSWCSYDPREAARCAARVRHLACDDYATGAQEEACDLVFDCGFDQ